MQDRQRLLSICPADPHSNLPSLPPNSSHPPPGSGAAATILINNSSSNANHGASCSGRSGSLKVKMMVI